MISTHHFPMLSMAMAAFAAAVLVRKTRHPLTRVMILVCLGIFLTAQFAVMRLAGAPNVEEAEAAARVLYLVHALGAAPWAFLTALLGGTKSWRRFRGRTVFVGAAAVCGIALASLTASELVLTHVTRETGNVRVTLGVAGKLLLVYLTAVAAFILTQLETVLRAALRLPDRGPRVLAAMTGLSVIVYVYVAAEAFLYGRLQADTLALASLPASITCAAAGASRLRRSIDDMRFPMARGVVYSSFTLFVLGLLLIALGLMSRVTELVGMSLNRAFFGITGVVAVGLGVSLWVSPSWKRRVSEFIDENFYVNRHDYRKEWELMTREVRLSHDRGAMIRTAASVVSEIFFGRPVFIGIGDSMNESFTVYDAKGEIVPWAPSRQGPLARALSGNGTAVSFMGVDGNLDVVPAYVENEEALGKLDVDVVSPMVSGGHLVGFLALGNSSGKPTHTPEDSSLMTVVGAELANAVYGHLLLREVEERREGEALMKLSSFVLHDLKNSVSSLRGVLEGAGRYMDEPAFRRDLVESLGATTDRMSRLIERLGELRRAPHAPELRRQRISVATLLERALRHCASDTPSAVSLTLDVPSDVVTDGDPEMLEQVFVNLVRNALDAMDDDGRLVVRATRDARTGVTQITIEDEGCGMDPRFVAESLFRPFSSTKARGLGIGLYQCKNIVEDHGGHIRVETERGKGTRVEVTFPAVKEAECETVS